MDVNPPFTDQEKRFVLAEVIKTSSVPVEKLLPVFYDGSIQPDWHQMLLPHGRNLQSCMKTFDAIRPPPPPPPFHTQSYQIPLPAPPPKPPKRKPPPDSLETSGSANPSKRRISDITPHTSILPKPSSTSPGQGSPGPSSAGKKRGRPSKAAVAQRDAEAIARGEVIAPPRTSSLRPDTPGGGDRIHPPYQNIAPMLSPRPIASPITPAMYETPSFTSSEATSPDKKKRPPQKKVPKQGEASFLIPPPEPRTFERTTERTTYPSIVSALTDTIPTSYGGESVMQPAPTPQPTHTLPPFSSVSAPAPSLPPPRTQP